MILFQKNTRMCKLPIIKEKSKISPGAGAGFRMRIPKEFINSLLDLFKGSIPIPNVTIKPSLDQDTSKCKNMKNGMKMDDIVVNLVYKSKFEIEPVYQKTWGYHEDKPLEIKHSFKVQNQGPSFTNKSTNITFFIPHTDQIKLPNFSPFKIPDSTICNQKPFQGGFEAKNQKPNQMVCKDGSKCVVMECQIQAGMKKGDEREFKIRLSFQRSNATNGTNFVVTTGARIDDQGNFEKKKSQRDSKLIKNVFFRVTSRSLDRIVLQ